MGYEGKKYQKKSGNGLCRRCNRPLSGSKKKKGETICAICVVEERQQAQKRRW